LGKRAVASKPHKALLDLIESWEKEQLDFLMRICEVNSHTFNKKGVDKVSTLILEKLEGVFPFHRVVENSETGNHHILKTHKEGKAIYLLGHTDTVFPPDHVFQKCTVQGEWLNGPGTADMKGGLTVIVYALRALKLAEELENIKVALILGADEENGSVTSQEIYDLEREKASHCLVAECAGEKGEIVVSRNGKAGGRLQCKGRDRHVGSSGKDRASAILEIAHKVIAFESLNGSIPGVRVNVGRIEGGLGSGTIPGSASFLFDLRWKEEEHFAPLLEKVKKIVSKSENPMCSSYLDLLNHRPAMPQTEKTEELLPALKKTAGILNQKIGLEHRKGTSDANFFGAFGVPTLDGFGPIGIKDHTPEERILISSLKERTSLLALFLINLRENTF
jgi:glutamate carboxypeptidase